MKLNELAQLIGRHGQLHTEGSLQVEVKVLDVKQAYGRTRYVVTPISGSGQVTVESQRVTLEAGV